MLFKKNKIRFRCRCFNTKQKQSHKPAQDGIIYMLPWKNIY